MIGNSGPPTTLLKVPRVRVRPELAQIARDTELAKMYGNKEVGCEVIRFCCYVK